MRLQVEDFRPAMAASASCTRSRSRSTTSASACSDRTVMARRPCSATISGLIRATAGKVTFDGEDITGRSPQAIVGAGLVHVPQGSTLLPRMSVQEALTLGAYSRRAWPQRHKTMEQVFAIFPRLAERREQRCNTLSGGERQMAAIGAGLMGCPRLLMLDEPTLGLAPKLRSELAARSMPSPPPASACSSSTRISTCCSAFATAST